MSLFSTHPPLEKRIAQLRGGSFGQGPRKRKDFHGSDKQSGTSMKDQARGMWDRLSD